MEKSIRDVIKEQAELRRKRRDNQNIPSKQWWREEYVGLRAWQPNVHDNFNRYDWPEDDWNAKSAELLALYQKSLPKDIPLRYPENLNTSIKNKVDMTKQQSDRDFPWEWRGKRILKLKPSSRVGEVDYIPQQNVASKQYVHIPAQDIKHINTTLVPKDKDQENSKVNQSYVPWMSVDLDRIKKLTQWLWLDPRDVKPKPWMSSIYDKWQSYIPWQSSMYDKWYTPDYSKMVSEDPSLMQSVDYSKMISEDRKTESKTNNNWKDKAIDFWKKVYDPKNLLPWWTLYRLYKNLKDSNLRF